MLSSLIQLEQYYQSHLHLSPSFSLSAANIPSVSKPKPSKRATRQGHPDRMRKKYCAVEERSDANWMLTHCWKKQEWKTSAAEDGARRTNDAVEEARLPTERKEGAREPLLAEKAMQTEKTQKAGEENVKDATLDQSRTLQQDSKKPVATKKSSVSLKQKLSKNLLFRYK